MHSLPIAKLSVLTSDYICNTISKAKSHWISMHASQCFRVRFRVSQQGVRIAREGIECITVFHFIHTVLQSQSLATLQSCYVLQHKRALLQSNGLECMAVLLSASGPGPLAKVLHPRHLGRCPFWHQHQKLCFDINIKSWDKSSELWIQPNYPRTQVGEEL